MEVLVGVHVHWVRVGVAEQLYGEEGRLQLSMDIARTTNLPYVTYRTLS